MKELPEQETPLILFSPVEIYNGDIKTDKDQTIIYSIFENTSWSEYAYISNEMTDQLQPGPIRRHSVALRNSWPI